MLVAAVGVSSPVVADSLTPAVTASGVGLVDATVDATAEVELSPGAASEAEPDVGLARELVEMRTSTSESWLRSDGSIETTVSAVPDYMRDAMVLRADPVGWVSGGDGVVPVAVSVPSSTAGAVTVSDRTGSVASTLVSIGAREAGAVEGAADAEGSVLFRGVAGGVDVRVDRTVSGVQESVIVADAASVPDSLVWSLRIDGFTPRLDGSGVVLFDGAGEEAGSIPAPFARDAAGAIDDGLKVGFDQVSDGEWVYTIGMDREWATGADREFPVVIDPPVVLGADQDCLLKSGLSGSCGWPILGVSATPKVRHSVLEFDVDTAIASVARNAAVNVEFAELGLAEENVYTSGAIDAHVVTTGWGSSASWTSPWATAGGDYVADPIPAAG